MKRNKVNPFQNEYSAGGIIGLLAGAGNAVGNAVGNTKIGEKVASNKWLSWGSAVYSPATHNALMSTAKGNIQQREDAAAAEETRKAQELGMQPQATVLSGMPQPQNQALSIDQMYQQGIMANGGMLPDSTGGGMFTSNDFTSFDAGGLHEENPYGGIPQGTGVNGKMNTVEEGETSFKTKDGKYIFSNRLRYTPTLK